MFGTGENSEKVGKLNILYCHRTRGRAVEGVHIREIVNSWTQKGHQVDVFGPPGTTIEENRKEAPSGILSGLYAWTSSFLPELIFEILEIAYNFSAGRKLEKTIKGKKYDLLYERYAIFNWIGVKNARKYGIPMILEVNYTSQTPLVRKRNFILKPFAGWIDRFIFQKADGIVVVSSYLKNHLKNDFSVPGNKMILLPNAADPIRFSPGIGGFSIRDLMGLREKFVIGFVGGFYPWHRVDLLCKAYLVISKIRNNISVVLIGDGPERPNIKKWVTDNGVEEGIKFVDPVTHQDLPKYLNALDVAVMPHSNDYGSPMKIYEYMSMGIPVVAPRLGPLADGINEGIEGLLFEPENLEDLTSALLKIIDDEKFRKEMGRAARKKVIESHSWGKNSEAILELKQKIEN